MPTAYSSVRFSSTQQSHGDSETRQDATPEPWCLAHGYTLDTTLRLKDLGRSGFHADYLKRGALGVFLELVRQGKIVSGSVLLIEHLDRLTRQQPIEGMEIIRSLTRAGIDVVALMDGQRYNVETLNDFGVYIKLQITLFQSHSESDKKLSRLISVWETKRERARNGGSAKSNRPAWVKPDGSVDEEKANIVRQLFTRYVKVGGSFDKFAKNLNAQEGKPPGGGKKWNRCSVQHFLTTGTTIGRYQTCRRIGDKNISEGDQGDPIEGFFLALLPTFRTSRRHFLRITVCALQKRFQGGSRAIFQGFPGIRNGIFLTHESRTSKRIGGQEGSPARIGKSVWISVQHPLEDDAGDCVI